MILGLSLFFALGLGTPTSPLTKNENLQAVMEGPITINIGGQLFTTTKSTWAKSPVIEMFINRDKHPIFIDRSPKVFEHILDWLREGRLYIDCPDNSTYERLRADADFYGIEDLKEFLSNRLNLHSWIYISDPNGNKVICDLDAFRLLEPSNGLLDRLLCGLGNYSIINNTIECAIRIMRWGYILRDPRIEIKNVDVSDGLSENYPAYKSGRESAKALLGSRIVDGRGRGGVLDSSYSYIPKLRSSD